MILKKLIVGPIGTNCYIFGSESTREVVIIDPGGDAKDIINAVEDLNAKPIAVLLTHGHFDHSMKVGRIKRHFEIPLKYNKKEYDSGIYSQKKADKWLNEGDIIKIGDINLHVLETPGHSPGALSYYTPDVKEYNGQYIDGLIFTGDLLFRRSIGRTDIGGGDQQQLFSSIKNKIIKNPEITNDFLVFPGHMGKTTIAEEKQYNFYRNYFL
ncbi:MAG: MBL fold metallo-hydrolase [Candidatus Lokiarchaeota archaeon]|nr:MBL fold metallo-hydrolase [Candidatus Lokiarchaeota archaeon]